MTDDDSGEVMTDADFEKALDALREQDPNGDVGELLKMMNENRMISWEEAEQILGGTSYNEPVKSSLPEQTRPSEPDNDTDVDVSIQRLLANDPKLKEINLNNMKRTPIPQLKRLIAAIRDNTYLEKLALANMGLYDSNVEPLFDVVENNETLKSINLETNYLSGDFFAKLFQAALKNQTLEEVKAVNQGVTFSTTSEKEIIDAIFANRGITKVSINLRLPEGRHKIENAMLRNGEIKRVLRRQAAQAAKAAEEANKKAEEEQQKATKTDEVKKDSTKKVATATKAAVGATKKPASKTAKTDTAPATAPTKSVPATGAAAAKLASAAAPTKTAAKTTTGKADDSATKAVKTKTAPKTPLKSTADSSTKAPPTKTTASAADGGGGTKKSTTDAKSAESTATPTKTKPKAAAATEKKTTTTAPTSSTKEADSTDAKPKPKTAPAVPPKKKTVTKSATEKTATADSKVDEGTSATKSKTPSKVAPKKSVTSDDKLTEPLPVYPLKKTHKQ